MIRIRLTDAKKSELVSLHERRLAESPYSVSRKIATLMLTYFSVNRTRYDFWNNVELNLRDILVGTPEVLSQVKGRITLLYDAVIREIKRTSRTKEERKGRLTEFKKEIFSVFNYDAFCKNYEGYGAYFLTKSLGVNVCPYCNRLNTNTILTKQGKTRARIDHWFDKSRYPYLALSLFNLVPSCHVCNSDLKNTKEFKLDEFVHPYLEGYEEDFKFKTKITRANYRSGDLDSFKIAIEPESNATSRSPIYRRAKNSIKVFCIEELYNCHKEKAGEIIDESDMYSEAFLEGLIELSSSTGRTLFSSKRDIVERIFKIKLRVEDFDKEPLAKFKRDIAEEQGLPLGRLNS